MTGLPADQDQFSGVAQMAMLAARSAVSDGRDVGPNTVSVLIAELERLASGGSGEAPAGLTERLDAALLSVLTERSSVVWREQNAAWCAGRDAAIAVARGAVRAALRGPVGQNDPMDGFDPLGGPVGGEAGQDGGTADG